MKYGKRKPHVDEEAPVGGSDTPQIPARKRKNSGNQPWFPPDSSNAQGTQPPNKSKKNPEQSRRSQRKPDHQRQKIKSLLAVSGI